jgi:RsiW-degrading membrane proteinase PrsW (M82 family)
LDFIALLLVAVVPAVGLMITIYKKDVPKPEPLRLLVLAFLGGLIAVGLTLVIGIYIILPYELNVIMLPGNPWTLIAFRASVSAGLFEESSKLFFLLLLIWRRKEFDEILDGIVYMVAVSMGFAALENVFYGYFVFGGATLGFYLRGITAVPAIWRYNGLLPW